MIKKMAAALIISILAFGMTVTVHAEDGEIKITNAKEGQTYDAYRVFDISSDPETGGTTYRLADKFSGFSDFTYDDDGYCEAMSSFFTVNDDRIVVIDEFSMENDIDIFSRAVIKFVKSNGIGNDGSTTATEDNEAVICVNKYGYYVVDSSLGRATSIAVFEKGSKVEVEDKNGVPNIDLKVTDATNPSSVFDDNTGNDAQIGDTVDLAITAGLRKWGKDYEICCTFTSGLTLVDLQDSDISFSGDGFGYTIDNAYVNENGDKGFMINFKGEPKADLTVTVSYRANVNSNAVIASEQNLCEAFIRYGNGAETEHVTTATMTYPLRIKRTSGSDENETALGGAEFEIYRFSDESKVMLTKVSNTEYWVDSEGTESSFVTVADTPVSVLGLSAEDYILVEKKQPQGIDKLNTNLKVNGNKYSNAKMVTVSDNSRTGAVQVENISNDTSGDYWEVPVDKDVKTSELKTAPYNVTENDYIKLQNDITVTIDDDLGLARIECGDHTLTFSGDEEHTLTLETIKGGNISITGGKVRAKRMRADNVSISGGTVECDNTGKTDPAIDAVKLEVSGEKTLLTAKGDNSAIRASGSIEIKDPLGIVKPEGGVIRKNEGTSEYHIYDGDTVSKDVVIKKPKKEYSITVTTEGNGTAGADKKTAEKGEKITLTAKADKGWKFVKWQVVSGGVTISKNSFTMPGNAVKVKAVFERETVSIKDAKVVLKKNKFVYNGEKRIPAVNTIRGLNLKKDTDYTVSVMNDKGKEVSSPKAVGKYTMVIKGKGIYTGSTKAEYEIVKADNPLKVTAAKEKYNVMYSKLKNADQTIKKADLFKFRKNGEGTITYSISSAKKDKKSFKRFFGISSKGKLKIKKGLEKGTYSLKVNVKADGSKNYKKATKTVKFTVKVKK